MATEDDLVRFLDDANRYANIREHSPQPAVTDCDKIYDDVTQ